MSPATHSLVVGLHASPAQWVLAVTGGGASAAGNLLSVPGGSRSILEIVVPYQEEALADFLGQRPGQYCSAPTSQAMARRALARARWLASGEALFGLGCTASLVSDRPKHGGHRAHVSVAGREQLRTWSLELNKGARDRAGEESIAAELVLFSMAQALGLPAPAPTLLAGEKLAEEYEPDGVWPACLEKNGALLVEADGRMAAEADWNQASPQVVVPGAFNPLHAGHLALAEAAARLEGRPAVFELSVTNVDKAELVPEEVRRRLGQFVGQSPVWLTRAPRFVDKAQLFPGATFAVGADTAARLVDPRYYGGDDQTFRQAFDLFRRQGCRFLVAARVDSAGRRVTLDDIDVPVDFRDLFRAIPSEEFRMDISSSYLRAR